MSVASNILFCFNNYVGEAVLVASSEADPVDMPVENLVSKNRDLVWRSVAELTPGVSETIAVTLDDPEAYPVSVFAFVDLFMSPTGTVRIQSWVDAVSGAVPGVDITYDAFSAFNGYGVDGFGQGGYGGGSVQDTIDVTKPVALMVLPAFREEKYWLITFTDPETTYVQASHMHVGAHWQPDRNISKGFSREVEDRTELIQSVGGQEYGDDRDERIWMQGAIRHLDQQDADYLYSKFLRLKKRVPFIVCAKFNDTIEQLYTTKLMRFDSLKMTQDGFDNYSAEIILREWL